MTCAEALELVEPIAAGDLAVARSARAHFESCPRCASALASARRIEAILRSRPAPEPPPRFTQLVLARIRRERWRAEQQVDRLFNVAIAAAVLLIAGGSVALLNVRTVLSAAGAGLDLLRGAGNEVVVGAGPALATYVGAAGLLVAALFTWWWAERRLSL